MRDLPTGESLFLVLYFAVLNREGKLHIQLIQNETTGIKAIDNGKLTMENEVYDLQGRRLQGTAGKGIYIQNGKKVIIR